MVRNLTVEEDTAFWAWACIETMRHSGVRVEELLELTQLSIGQYQRPNGEVVALMVIAPSKNDRERIVPMYGQLLHIVASIMRRHCPVSPGVEPAKDQEAVVDGAGIFERVHPLAVIQADDVMGPRQLQDPGASTWFKVSLPSLESLKLAVRTPETRILIRDPRSMPRPRIKSVSWVGGYLDGVSVPVVMTALTHYAVVTPGVSAAGSIPRLMSEAGELPQRVTGRIGDRTGRIPVVVMTVSLPATTDIPERAGRLAIELRRDLSALVAPGSRGESSRPTCEGPPRESRSTSHRRCT